MLPPIQKKRDNRLVIENVHYRFASLVKCVMQIKVQFQSDDRRILFYDRAFLSATSRTLALYPNYNK